MSLGTLSISTEALTLLARVSQLSLNTEFVHLSEDIGFLLARPIGFSLMIKDSLGRPLRTLLCCQNKILKVALSVQ